MAFTATIFYPIMYILSVIYLTGWFSNSTRYKLAINVIGYTINISTSFKPMNYKLILALLTLSLLAPQAYAQTDVVRTQVKQFKENAKDMRQNLKDENTEEWKKMIEENKQEREDFREKVKNMIISKTPEELKNLKPTIKAERKNLLRENKAQRKDLRQQNKKEHNELQEKVKAAFLDLRKKLFGL